jgi:hypothetical protein
MKESYEIEEGEMSMIYMERNEKSVRNFGQETSREEDT